MFKTMKVINRVILSVVLLIIILSGCSGQTNEVKQGAQTEQNIMAQQAAKIAELEEKFVRMENIEQIKQLKARYFRFVDEKKWNEFGELFTADAKLVSDGQDYSKGGPAAYGKMIGDLVGKAPTVHHGYMPEIEIVDKDTAKGIWAMEDLLTFPDAKNAYPGHHGYGQYHESYKKVDGVWKISSTELTRFRMDPLKNWDPNTDPVTGQPVIGK